MAFDTSNMHSGGRRDVLLITKEGWREVRGYRLRILVTDASTVFVDDETEGESPAEALTATDGAKRKLFASVPSVSGRVQGASGHETVMLHRVEFCRMVLLEPGGFYAVDDEPSPISNANTLSQETGTERGRKMRQKVASWAKERLE